MSARGVLAVAALLLAACCALSPAAAQVLPNLQVRTVDNFIVVANGVTNDPWGRDGPFAAPATLFPRYLISLDNDTAAVEQEFILSYMTSDADILITTAPEETATAVPGVQYESVVRTQCVTDGTADIMVAMEMTNPPGDTLTWSYTKTCVQPKVQIGVAPWDSDVVDSMGPMQVPIVAPEYDAQSGTPLRLMTDDEMVLYFYVANTVTVPDFVAPFRVDVVASSADVQIGAFVYNASYTDQMSTQTYAMFDTAHPISTLTVPISCVLGAASETTITVDIDYNWATPLVVSFVRQCTHTGAAIDLSIGTTYNSTDIAANGVVVGDWDTQTGHVYTVGNLFHSQFVFHMCLACAGDAPAVPAPTETYNVTITNLDSIVFAIVPTADQGQQSGTLYPRIDRPFAVDLICLTGGTGTVWFEVQLGEESGASKPPQSARFAFTYTCVFPMLNLAYEDLNTVVAKESKVVEPWTAFDTKLPTKNGPSQWYIFIDDSQPETTMPFQYYNLNFVHNPSLMGPPTIVDAGANSAEHMTPNYIPVSVTWNCNPNLQHIEYVPVTLVVSFGWAPQNNLEAYFLVPCAPGAKPSGGGGGWSAAGTFFFVVFILSLVGCVCGCVFNYVRVGKRGLAIVPLYETASRCVDKMRGNNRTEWTPQMDAESGVSARTTNYSNFGDGDGYQSNL